MNLPSPRLCRIRQDFSLPPPLDVRAVVKSEMEKLLPRVKSGARIGVGVGSRGIANLVEIVRATLDMLLAAGAKPFILPAMGSHGGATAEGQREVLAGYGISEAALKVPVLDSMETREIGVSADGVPCFCGVEALNSDGVILINRIKPHTDFSGTLGSGVLKMCVIGLGKQRGAAAMHAAASQFGHERILRGLAHTMLMHAPVLGGVAILEHQQHDTARIVVLLREEMETGEDALLIEARRLMPLLPFDEIDLLIVDRIGKNISGAGMDPNVIGRSVQGYFSALMRPEGVSPFIRRIFVRGLTEESHGNAIGIGMADVTTTRLVHAMDARATSINALTALTPQNAKIPIHFETDREAVELVMQSLALPDGHAARIVHISDTLTLTEMDVSEALVGEVVARRDLTVMGPLRAMMFDAGGNLSGIC
jgi:hypothetical protein